MRVPRKGRETKHGVAYVKLLKKSLKRSVAPDTTAMLKELSPEGRARVKRRVEALIRQMNLKLIKGRNLKRLYWAAGLLYMLDGICQNYGL